VIVRDQAGVGEERVVSDHDVAEIAIVNARPDLDAGLKRDAFLKMAELHFAAEKAAHYFVRIELGGNPHARPVFRGVVLRFRASISSGRSARMPRDCGVALRAATRLFRNSLSLSARRTDSAGVETDNSAVTDVILFANPSLRFNRQ